MPVDLGRLHDARHARHPVETAQGRGLALAPHDGVIPVHVDARTGPRLLHDEGATVGSLGAVHPAGVGEVERSCDAVAGLERPGPAASSLQPVGHLDALGDVRARHPAIGDHAAAGQVQPAEELAIGAEPPAVRECAETREHGCAGYPDVREHPRAGISYERLFELVDESLEFAPGLGRIRDEGLPAAPARRVLGIHDEMHPPVREHLEGHAAVRADPRGGACHGLEGVGRRRHVDLPAGGRELGPLRGQGFPDAV